jgi:glycosyltransferase involved in cell wall biosynthesis
MSKPLLYTLHCGNLYGTERMALATLEGLDEYERFVLAPPSPASPSLVEVARTLRYGVRRVQTRAQLLWALVPLFIRNRSIDVISTSVTHNVICMWLARLFFVRLRQLNVVHGGGEERYSYANKHHLNRTRVRVVAVSEFVRGRLLAHGVAPEKIVVIQNFLSPSDLAGRPRRPPFDAAMAEARPIDRSRVKVVVVSRVDPVKRLDVLLDAVATGRLSQFRFDVFGSGELLVPYQQRARALGGAIEFHGYVPDVAKRLSQADLFLHLCPDEPFGLVVLEAFAANLPVIVPQAGGVAELVQDGLSGVTYPATDVTALVSRLLETADLDGPRLDALTRGGRSALDNRYSVAAGVHAYRSALGQARR